MSTNDTSEAKTDNVSVIVACSSSVTNIANLDVNSKGMMFKVKGNAIQANMDVPDMSYFDARYIMTVVVVAVGGLRQWWVRVVGRVGGRGDAL
ncbi:hypothetical protein Tco_0392630 [Tanacetum coccineum]